MPLLTSFFFTKKSCIKAEKIIPKFFKTINNFKFDIHTLPPYQEPSLMSTLSNGIPPKNPLTVLTVRQGLTWTSHGMVDKLKPQIEVRSNASGLTPPR